MGRGRGMGVVHTQFVLFRGYQLHFLVQIKIAVTIRTFNFQDISQWTKAKFLMFGVFFSGGGGDPILSAVALSLELSQCEQAL